MFILIERDSIAKKCLQELYFFIIMIIDVPSHRSFSMNPGSIGDCDEQGNAQDLHEHQNVYGECNLHFIPFRVQSEEHKHHEQLWQLKQAIESHRLDH